MRHAKPGVKPFMGIVNTEVHIQPHAADLLYGDGCVGLLMVLGLNLYHLGSVERLVD